MSILGTLKTAYNSAVSYLIGEDSTNATSNANKANGAKNVHNTQQKKQTVPMNGTTKTNKNTDTTKFSSDKRNKIYKQIEQLCVENDLNPEHVKKENVLEKILGCSQDELTKKSAEEIGLAITALKKAISSETTLFFWHSNDIKKITATAKNKFNEICAEKANEQIRKETNGSWLGEKWNHLMMKSTLRKQLQSKGYLSENKKISQEEMKSAIKKLFVKEFLGEIRNLSPAERKLKYAEALTKFGYYLTKYNSPEDKAILTVVISQLQAEDREKATKIAIESCGINSSGKSQVAKSIDIEEVTMTVDANGQRCNIQGSTGIATLKFSNLTSNDYQEEIKNYNDKTADFYKKNGKAIKEIQEKQARGEALTEQEKELLARHENVYVAQGSGAIIGTGINTNLNTNEKVNGINEINNTVTSVGIQKEVYKNVHNYIESNKNSMGAKTTKEITELIDKSTNGSYSKEINASSSQNKKTEEKVQTENIKKRAEKTRSSNSIKEEKTISQNELNNTQEKTNDTKLSYNSYSKTVTDENKKQELATQKTKEKSENVYASQRKNIILDEKDVKRAENDIVFATRTNEGLKIFTKANGENNTALAIFDEYSKAGSAARVKAKTMFSRFLEKDKEKAITTHTGAGVSAMLRCTSDETKFHLAQQNKTFATFNDKRKVELAVKKVEENISA